MPTAAFTPSAIEREKQTARTLAYVGHLGQVSPYSREDYIDHVRRVVGLTTPRYKAVAWLHDVLEDTTLTVPHLKAAGLSDDTIRSVQLLTRKKPDPVQKQGQLYEAYLDLIVGAEDAAALLVKVADLRDHIRTGDPGRGREALPLDRVLRYETALERLLTVCLNRGLMRLTGL